MTDLQQNIQQQLADLDGEIELVALEQPRTDGLRLFIDHPGGVDLALCERVTKHLSHLLADYSLEVSSPGTKYRRNATASESKESAQ
jgi:ribosome maturation factor RimP